MVQNPSWEANWFAASQEIPRIFMEPEGSLLHSQASATCPCPGPAQSNPHPTSWRSILILSTHLCLVSPVVSFPWVSPPRPYTSPSPHPYAPHAQPISFFSILSPAQYWVSSTDHSLPKHLSVQNFRKVYYSTFYYTMFMPCHDET